MQIARRTLARFFLIIALIMMFLNIAVGDPLWIVCALLALIFLTYS